MIYVWTIPNSYPQKSIGTFEYDTARSPNWNIFTDGRKITGDVKTPYIKFSCRISDIEKYDCLPNSSLLPLVNKKICDIFDKICSSDVQFFDAVVECNDGILESYKIVNITHAVKAINHESSRYTFIIGTRSILRFQHLSYKPESLLDHQIVRDAEYDPHILVGEKLFSEFKKRKITGVKLMTVEEYNGTL